MKKFTRLYLTVFILLLSILTACSKPISTTEYLSDVNTDSLIESFDLEKDNLDKYNIYMIGEYHGTVGTFVTKLELIKYFYETHGVSDLIMETGYSSGFLLNRYINTGDEEILNTLLENSIGTSTNRIEYKEYLERIYEFNKSLPDDTKLKIHGVDVEHQYYVGTYLLELILRDLVIPTELKEYIDPLYTTPENFSIALNIVDKLTSSINSNRETYSNLLGDDYNTFVNTIEGITQGLNFYKNNSTAYREECFIKNSIRTIENIDGKSLALLGSWHTDMNGQDDIKTVGRALSEEYGTGSGGVSSIKLTYYKSFVSSNNGKYSKIKDSAGEELAKRTDQSLWLFKLDPDDNSKVIRELSTGQQYSILIKNSPPTTLLYTE